MKNVRKWDSDSNPIFITLSRVIPYKDSAKYPLMDIYIGYKRGRELDSDLPGWRSAVAATTEHLFQDFWGIFFQVFFSSAPFPNSILHFWSNIFLLQKRVQNFRN